MPPEFSLPPAYRQALIEICTEAAEKVSRGLHAVLGTPIHLSVPNIQVMHPSDVTMTLQSVDSNPSTHAVCQGFIGDNIAGEALLLFTHLPLDSLASLMHTTAPKSPQAECELLMDTTNLFLGACLNAIADQLDIAFSYDAPAVIGHHHAMEDIVKMTHAHWHQALVIETHYTIDGINADCDLLIILTLESLSMIVKKLNYLIEE